MTIDGQYLHEGVRPPFGTPRECLLLVWHLAVRQLVARYQGFALGFLWSLLNPLLMMVVYLFVFRIVFRAEIPGVPYAAFFLCGYLLWAAFAQSVHNNTLVILENRPLLDAHNFPAWALPAARVVAAYLHYLITLPLFAILCLTLGVRPGLPALVFPGVVALLFMLSLGAAFFVSSLTPAFRDVSQLVEIFMTVLYFATPVLYPHSFVEKALPAWALLIYECNPLAGIAALAHWSLLGLPMPWTALIGALVLPPVVLAVGFATFQRRRPGFNIAG